MALGTAEATPLQVATAYTTFANLGDRVLPMPITKVTAGDGRTVAAPEPDKKSVIRPDVAYIMDDIMKDVINRGTAAQVQGWGFRNVDGKAAFAGKTGTSRDGWFAGFTPELVCVVYVGFDNGDDLGMKGSDSAMPIWADFMKEALQLHPEWNGEWPMPATVRKAEIDTRNGSLIREIDAIEALNAKATPTPAATDSAPEDPDWATEVIPEAKEVFVTDVPEEFRRVELFIGGTIPNRKMVEDTDNLDDLYADPPPVPDEPNPRPSSTPLDGTWQEPSEPNNNSAARPAGESERQNRVQVTVCPLTGMRANLNCPKHELRTFQKGSEPKEYCTFHR
jgi:penicillin-binding protein 1B